MRLHMIVGYDGTEPSRDGLALAEQLARLNDAKLTLAYAYGGDRISLQIASAAVGVSLREEAEQVLERGAKSLPSELKVRTRALRDGSPGRALAELAEAEDADLLVIGSARHGPVGQALVGSAGEGLMHGAPCPVALAPKGYGHHPSGKISRLGVAWDGTDEAKLALGAAVELAREGGGELRLFTAIAPGAYPVDGYPGVYVPDELSLKTWGEETLAEGLKHVPDDVKASGEVLEGDPASVLASQAESEGLDLLVTGSRGYGPLRRVLVGAVSRRLARTAPCPVLVVPRGAG